MFPSPLPARFLNLTPPAANDRAQGLPKKNRNWKSYKPQQQQRIAFYGLGFTADKKNELLPGFFLFFSCSVHTIRVIHLELMNFYLIISNARMKLLGWTRDQRIMDLQKSFCKLNFISRTFEVCGVECGVGTGVIFPLFGGPHGKRPLFIG